jgi:anaerobic magnesium-protoporphyrin IX monomethyl ester cyclase
MNYLVVIPRFISKPGDFYFFPLGIAYVSASLKRGKRRVINLNLNQVDDSVDEAIRQAIEAHKIDVVLTGGLSGEYRPVKAIVQGAKAVKPDIVTVVGGGLVSSEPRIALEGLKADIGVIGEGEITVTQLSDALESGRNLSDINGLIYWESGALHITSPRKEISDLAKVPWPDYEGCGFSEYLDAVTKIPGNVRYVSMIASRSCPFRCTFCYHPSGSVYRQRSLDDLFREIDYMLDRFRVEYLNISDELFSTRQARVRDFCGRMKQRVDAYGFKWDIQLRVESVTSELLKLLKDSGCHIISYGIESADPTVLKSMKKDVTLEQIETALRLTHEAGILIQGNFIFGDAAETLETANSTLKWWEAHTQYGINLTPIKVFPGTPLYAYACEHGVIKDRLKYLEDGCPLINVSRMNEAELQVLNAKIKQYQKAASKPPARTSLVGVVGSGCQVSIVCSQCQMVSEHVCYPLSIKLSLGRGECPHCRQKLDLEDSVIDLVLERNFIRMLEADRKIAVWGCGDISNKLFEKSPILRGAPVYLVDNSPSRHGQTFWGHTVLPTDEISTHKVDTVVVASIRFADAIAKEIDQRFPNVERIIKFTDMSTLYQ